MQSQLKNHNTLFMILLVTFSSHFAFSQKIETKPKCGQPAFTQRIHQNQELSDRSSVNSQKRLTNKFNSIIDQGEIVTIPVVFHVIHQGEAIGVGRNVSEEQIFAQLEQMNLDLRKQSSDADDIPFIFKNLHADIQIEFCLAQRTPDNKSTTGITRHFYLDSQFRGNEGDDFEFNVKAKTYWNPDKYLNIWTANTFIIDEGLLGWAYFPENPPQQFYDGIVASYGTIGSVDKPFKLDPRTSISRENMGKTVTHEIGHYLNLYHTWGKEDDLFFISCNDDDDVSDTPLTDRTYGGQCPSVGISTISCGSQDMFVNYMGYSPCIYMFTHGQKQRMRAALFGLRSSLLASNGCIPPSIYELKLYPNPASNYLNLDVSLQSGSYVDWYSEIIMHNSIGKRVFDEKVILTSSSKIDISELTPNQIYFVNIKDVNGDEHEFKILKTD